MKVLGLSVKPRKIESEKGGFKQLSECGGEVKASSSDDMIVKGVWGTKATEDCAKERI